LPLASNAEYRLAIVEDIKMSENTTSYQIPAPVAKAVSGVLASHYYSHRVIDNLFQEKGAIGDIPPGNLVEKCTTWLKRANSADNPLEFLGKILEEYMEVDADDEGREEITEILARYDLAYQQGGVIVTLTETTGDLFEKQFPVGLPFGVPKPNFAITAQDGGQSLKFELESGIGIIWRDVYPSFDFQVFEESCGITSSTNLALKKALVAMNQTKWEKVFFRTYARHFGMADNHIPMLIPQAWIQWHSLPKRVLRTLGRPLADEPYRIDFVAFWENQRYAILIDDISHYAVKGDRRWMADEEAYSKRLEEDRKLQIEGWRVFRVSNWEIKQDRIDRILVVLRAFVGF
jgi:very-short-patch-repair endonuclease